MVSTINQRVARELSVATWQVDAVAALLDEGNTIPFIARYRKEMHGSLDDDALRDLHERLLFLRKLEEHRADCMRKVEEQGALTDELRAAFEACEKLALIDDLYAPYKKKRQTRGSIARARGLEPLALLIRQGCADVYDQAQRFINEENGVRSVGDAIDGACDIIAEDVSLEAGLKSRIRDLSHDSGVIVTTRTKEPDAAGLYDMYAEFSYVLARIPSHNLLAIRRGERAGLLRVGLQVDEGSVYNLLYAACVTQQGDCGALLKRAVDDGYTRLMAPSIQNELLGDAYDAADASAIGLFGKNLKHLLLTPPLVHVIMGIDPAYRTGCKVAVVDSTGLLRCTTVVYPTPPHNDTSGATETLRDLIKQHRVTAIAIGNGTASRETEMFVADMIKPFKGKVRYCIVDEAGASVYSASKAAAEELPELDVTERGAVSIARRLLDPMSELVKIEPRSIGVGQYQHDIDSGRLSEALAGVVESAVNAVGVDVNTASESLLTYVSGIKKNTAKQIVEYRKINGRIRSRDELKKVKTLGDRTFTQCAGFLRIRGADNPLDGTGVHPESYGAAYQLLELTNHKDTPLQGGLPTLRDEVGELGIEAVAEYCGVGVPTLNDIVDELSRPGRDIREKPNYMPLRTHALTLEALTEGMSLTGTVRNVTDFGAFVDIGVHTDGLLHKSRMGKRVNHPMDVVHVGDTLQVTVAEVDVTRKRIALCLGTV